jgi:hypothetical protein
MEATPPPPPPPPPPEAMPPPPPPVPGDAPKASGGMRALAVLGALVLAFAAAVIITVMVDLGKGPLCGEPHDITETCWDVSSGGRVVSLIFGWPGAILGVVAALAALAFALTGRNGRRVWVLTGAAVVLCGLSIAVAQIT